MSFDYIEKRKRENQIAQARLQRLKNQRQRAQGQDAEANTNESSRQSTRRARNSNSQINNNETASAENSTCVICLINPRELVLLDCGHVCLCMDCFGRFLFIETLNCIFFG